MEYNHNQPFHTEKQMVWSKLVEIIESGEILSRETGLPLTVNEKGEYISRATFHLIQEEIEWNRNEGNEGRLPPIYDTFLFLLSYEERSEGRGIYAEALKSTVETYCNIPTKEEDDFKEYVKEEQKYRFPQGDDVPPEFQADETNLSKMQKMQRYGYQIMSVIQQAKDLASFGKEVVSQAGDEVMGIFNGALNQPVDMSKAAGNAFVVAGAYAGLIGAWNAIQVRRGKRSWIRAKKNIVDEGVSCFSGAGTGLLTSFVLAPVTGGYSLIFGAVAGIYTSLKMKPLIKKKTGDYWDIPEDELLEKALNVLGTSQKDDNEKIAKAYRQMSLACHPDKFIVKNPDASDEEKNRNLRQFLKVQAALAVIMTGRVEDEHEEFKMAKENLRVLLEEERNDNKFISVGIRVNLTYYWGQIVDFMGWKGREELLAITDGILPVCVFDVENDHLNEVGNKMVDNGLGVVNAA